VIDLVIVGFALIFAVNGYRHGLISSAFSFVGFLIGVVIGAQIAGRVATAITDDPVVRVILALVIVFGLAGLG